MADEDIKKEAEQILHKKHNLSRDSETHTPRQEQSQATNEKPAIRTMKSDIDELFKSNKPSLIQIIQREKSLDDTDHFKRSMPWKKFFVYIASFTLAAVIIFAGFVYISSLLSSTAPTQQNGVLTVPKPFFAVENTKIIAADTSDPLFFQNSFRAIGENKQRSGTMINTIVKVQDGPQVRYATAGDIFNFFGITPPTNFLSLLQGNSMTFFYFSGNGSSPGIIVQSSDPERSFSQLLNWEGNLSKDLSVFLENKASTSTPVKGTFIDQTYRNIDYRFVPASAGEADRGVSYGIFPAKKLIIICASKQEFNAVIDRLFEQ